MRFLALLAATFPIKAQKPQASIWLVKSSPLSNGREQRKRRLLLPMASCYHFLKKCFLFIFIVFEKQIDREMREEDCVYLLVHFLGACNSWDWNRLKPGAQNSAGVTKWVTGAQVLEPSPFPPRVHINRARTQSQALRYGMQVPQEAAYLLLQMPSLLFSHSRETF